MKNILILILIFTVNITSSQDMFYETICNCINQIKDKSNQSNLVYQTEDCLQKSTSDHPEIVEKILKDYVDDNSELTIEFAENNSSEILSEKLKNRCSEFKEIDSSLKTQRVNSENIIEMVADNICIELKKEPNLSQQILSSITKKSIQKYLVSIYGQYNLKDSLEFKKFNHDLKLELMENCDLQYKSRK
ncbi:hypothetical protein [Bizionia arctica]|uniref:Uncharacterized protein n=1 Tax=Bizionia arctica TaxID=1495645 RepID=A0A917GIB1_9FLAO|nr:hypothetical protein [Bizionia arctica]GGG46906.1 hypothetical protein GCM10010976_17930 [Bizionia arctica]